MYHKSRVNVAATCTTDFPTTLTKCLHHHHYMLLSRSDVPMWNRLANGPVEMSKPLKRANFKEGTISSDNSTVSLESDCSSTQASSVESSSISTSDMHPIETRMLPSDDVLTNPINYRCVFSMWDELGKKGTKGCDSHAWRNDKPYSSNKQRKDPISPSVASNIGSITSTSNRVRDSTKIADKVTLESLLAKDDRANQNAVETSTRYSIETTKTMDYESILSKWKTKNKKQKDESQPTSLNSKSVALRSTEIPTMFSSMPPFKSVALRTTEIPTMFSSMPTCKSAVDSFPGDSCITQQRNKILHVSNSGDRSITKVTRNKRNQENESILPNSKSVALRTKETSTLSSSLSSAKSAADFVTMSDDKYSKQQGKEISPPPNTDDRSMTKVTRNERQEEDESTLPNSESVALRRKETSTLSSSLSPAKCAADSFTMPDDVYSKLQGSEISPPPNTESIPLIRRNERKEENRVTIPKYKSVALRTNESFTFSSSLPPVETFVDSLLCEKRLTRQGDEISHTPNTEDRSTPIVAIMEDHDSVAAVKEVETIATTNSVSCRSSESSSTTALTKNHEDHDGLPLHPAEKSVMAMLLKPSASTPLGIQLNCYGWRFMITQIDKTSLMYQSDLKVGQTLLAVNGIPANEFASPQAIMNALLVSRKVVIIATKSVLSWTDKPLGIVLGHSVQDGLFISQLFKPHPILQKGMTVIALNHETDLELHIANRILHECQTGNATRLSILAVPAKMSTKAVSSMTLYLDETCVTAQLLPSCRTEFCKHNDSRVTIANIHNHPKLRVGQTVLAINGMPANCFSSVDEIQALVDKAPTLIFASNTIMATAVKPTTTTKVGIAFRALHGQVHIHRIDPRGLFKDTLKEGMKVVAINGSPCPRSLEAANAMVKDCVGTLTIIVLDDDHKAEP